MSTTPPMRTITSPLYGVTLDGNTANSDATIKSTLDALPPTNVIARIVFDEGVAPSAYTPIIDTLKPTTFLMGELLDSESLANITTAAYLQRTKDYVALHGEKVDLWEIGNEIIGWWAGPYDGDEGQVAKISAAFDWVKSKKKKTALTLWQNVGCVDQFPDGTNELTPMQFIQQKLPQRMIDGLDYLFLSYYEVPCGRRPSVAEFKAEFESIHAAVPNAKLGFGEVGMERKIGTNLALAQSIANYYYGLSQSMALPSWYVGGYFWWYAEQDIVPKTKPLWATIAANMDY